MYSFSFHRLLPVVLTVVMPMALAQPSTGSATPDSKSAAPSSPSSSPSITLSYLSAFANYRAYSEQPVGSWIEANDNVAKIGGWRTYAKEARQPEAKP